MKRGRLGLPVLSRALVPLRHGHWPEMQTPPGRLDHTPSMPPRSHALCFCPEKCSCRTAAGVQHVVHPSTADVLFFAHPCMPAHPSSKGPLPALSFASQRRPRRRRLVFAPVGPVGRPFLVLSQSVESSHETLPTTTPVTLSHCTRAQGRLECGHGNMGLGRRSP